MKEPLTVGNLSNDVVGLTLDEVRDLATSVFVRRGLSADQTRAVVDTVTAAERDDCKSHGLFRVPGYVASLDSGKVDPHAVPVLSDWSPAVVQVDAAHGFAPLALEVGRAPLAQKARTQGIAALAVVNTFHFAALWPEVEALADEGLVAFAFTAAKSFVAPAGGVAPLYGTNPMAFDPARFTASGNSDAQLAHAEQLFAKVLAQDGARLPSDRRFAARERTPTEGVTIPASLFETLTELTNA